MHKKEPYQVSVNNRFQYDISPESIDELDLVPNGEQQFHLLLHGRSFHARLVSTDYSNRSMVIQIRGRNYHVHIADHYERLIQQLGLSVGGSQKINTLKAPMPGLVRNILVKQGQQVEKGTPLFILEAMKMENILKAAGDAVVQAIHVAEGDAVDKGQLLLEFA